MSAWCLAILNSHGRLFLGYSAPVVWNICQIIVLIVLAISEVKGQHSGRGLGLGSGSRFCITSSYSSTDRIKK